MKSIGFLKQKFLDKNACIAVVGLGYVGLPLAIAFTEAGFNVIGLDVSKQRIESLNMGLSHVEDVPSEKIKNLVNKNKIGNILFSHDYTDLTEADAVIICVPTPLSKSGDPDMTYVASAGKDISRNISPQTLIVLESTTYPGATKDMLVPIIFDGNKGFSLGDNIYVAFSPERIDPGRKDYDIKTTPKVIGGITENCSELAVSLYGTVVETPIVVPDTTTAEMVKLLENTFRATNIALVNEVAIMCDRLGVDVWEVIEAAETKPFGFMSFYPGPGLGGHCIPIDPKYLSWKMKQIGYEARFINLADEINSSMPTFVKEKLKQVFLEKGKQVKGSNILILGVSYKPDISDTRESPALDLIELLNYEGANISYSDPHVPELILPDGSKLHSNDLKDGDFNTIDAVIIVSNHKLFDLPLLSGKVDLIIDTRNATSGLDMLCEVVKL